MGFPFVERTSTFRLFALMAFFLRARFSCSMLFFYATHFTLNLSLSLSSIHFSLTRFFLCCCYCCLFFFLSLLPHICRFLSSFVICVHCILCMFSTSFATLLAPLLNEMQSCCCCCCCCYCACIRNYGQIQFCYWQMNCSNIRLETFWFLFINLTIVFICSVAAWLPVICLPPCNRRSGFISVYWSILLMGCCFFSYIPNW